MADLSRTAAQISPLSGSLVRPYDAGEALEVGDAVYIAADGDVNLVDANTAASSEMHGIVVASADTSPSIAAGARCSVCVLGPVAGFSGLTPGARAWVSENAGELADAAPTGAGTWTRAAGFALEATIFFVQPGVEAPASNS